MEKDHIGEGFGKAYNPNCMCKDCHTTWEMLFMAGDSVIINGWVKDMNEASNDTR